MAASGTWVSVGDGDGVALGGGRVGVGIGVAVEMGSTGVGSKVNVGIGSAFGLQPKSNPTISQTRDRFHALKSCSSRGAVYDTARSNYTTALFFRNLSGVLRLDVGLTFGHKSYMLWTTWFKPDLLFKRFRQWSAFERAHIAAVRPKAPSR